ncbi:Guanine nucleotide exchange protein smcr8 [Mactra antiquata]
MFGADAAHVNFQFENQTQQGKTKTPDPLDYLFPKFIRTSPWLHTGYNGSTECLEDFIMIAEFSEQEGPRPVIIIPKDGGQNFNQNDFAVKILAVDHQSSIVEGFESTEDAQVVMNDPETDSNAFIHHIVLNDIQARGYVRPFCISYVTTDPLKIMKCYEEISSQMKKVARLMKFGNRLVFMRDLEKFQEDLSYTKAHLLISQSRTQNSPQGDNDLLNALNTLRQSMEEVKDILSNLKPLLQLDADLSERFQSYEREVKGHRHQHDTDSDSSSLKDFDTKDDHFAEKELSGSCTDRTSPIFSLFSKCRNQKPKVLDVSTIRGKRRFDRSLRGLHELCSWGAKEGLQKLRAFREFLKRDVSSIYVDELDLSSLVPDCGVLCFGSNTVGANFLSTFDSVKGHSCSRRKTPYYTEDHCGLNSLGSVESFKSLTSSFHSFFDDDTMYSAQSSMAETTNSAIPFHRNMSIGSENHEDSDIIDTAYDQEFIFQHDNSEEVNNEFSNTVESMSESVSNSLVNTLTNLSNVETKPAADSNIVDEIEHPIENHFLDEYYDVDIDKDLVCSAKGCKCHSKNDKSECTQSCCNGPKGTAAKEKKDETVNAENNKNVEKCINDPEKVLDKTCDNISGLNGPESDLLSSELEKNPKSKIADNLTVITKNDNQNVKDDMSTKTIENRKDEDQVNNRKESLTSREDLLLSGSPYKQSVNDSKDFMFSNKSLDSGFDLTSRHGNSVLTESQSSFGMSYSGITSNISNVSHRRSWFSHSSKFLFDGESTLGQSLQKVLSSYNNMQHVVYSLLSGRPVVVIGTRKHENSLREILQALSVFVPYTPKDGSVSLLCQVKQMKMVDIHKFQLRGLIRSDRKSVDYLLPKTCRRYLTLVDLEKQQICCQPYQGMLLNFLLSIHSKKKTFKSDTGMYSYIQLCLEEISSKVFSFYHGMTSSDIGMNIHGSSVLHKSVMLEASSEKYLGEVGVRNSDCKIIKYLSEVVKIQQIDEEFKSKYLTDAPAYPFSVNYQALQTFKL